MLSCAAASCLRRACDSDSDKRAAIEGRAWSVAISFRCMTMSATHPRLITADHGPVRGARESARRGGKRERTLFDGNPLVCMSDGWFA